MVFLIFLRTVEHIFLAIEEVGDFAAFAIKVMSDVVCFRGDLTRKCPRFDELLTTLAVA